MSDEMTDGGCVWCGVAGVCMSVVLSTGVCLLRSVCNMCAIILWALSAVQSVCYA